MRKITIKLSDALYRELANATDGIRQQGYTPEVFATEVVENELASRRLRSITPGRNGARITEPETEPTSHRVLWPGEMES